MQVGDVDGQMGSMQDNLLTLGDWVESMLILSADLLQRCDLEGLERLGEEERSVHELRLAIEMGCLGLISTHKPRDGSLRSAVAMIEIASDLEQMSGHARQIARANYLALDGCLGKSLDSIRHLVTVVQTLLHQAMQAVAQRDEETAQAVFVRALEMDSLYETVHQELLLLMQHRPRFANQAIHLARSVSQLKQAGERVTSICEWIVYAIRGEIHATSNV